LGGDQTAPFVVLPADRPLENQPIVGAGTIRARFKRWINAPQPEAQPHPSSAGRASGLSRESKKVNERTRKVQITSHSFLCLRVS